MERDVLGIRDDRQFSLLVGQKVDDKVTRFRSYEAGSAEFVFVNIEGDFHSPFWFLLCLGLFSQREKVWF